MNVLERTAKTAMAIARPAVNAPNRTAHSGRSSHVQPTFAKRASTPRYRRELDQPLQADGDEAGEDRREHRHPDTIEDAGQ